VVQATCWRDRVGESIAEPIQAGIFASRRGEPHVQQFSTLRYDRVCRTPHSEAYLLSEGDQPVGRVDLHFGASVVHALLIVERELPEVELRALVQRLDEDLVWTADQPREDFLVTVYRGSEVVVVSDEGDEGDDDGDDDEDDDEA
jgi:hypothetical protein